MGVGFRLRRWSVCVEAGPVIQFLKLPFPSHVFIREKKREKLNSELKLTHHRSL